MIYIYIYIYVVCVMCGIQSVLYAVFSLCHVQALGPSWGIYIYIYIEREPADRVRSGQGNKRETTIYLHIMLGFDAVVGHSMHMMLTLRIYVHIQIHVQVACVPRLLAKR